MEGYCQLFLGLFVVILVVGIDNVTGRKCYVCNSGLDGNCADPGRLSNLYRECSSSTGSGDRCIKIMGPGTLISRDCATPFNTGGFQTDGCNVNGNVQTCACSSDYCNLSAKTASTMGLLGVMAISGLVLLYGGAF